MVTDPWLPIGLRVDGSPIGRILQSGSGWQIYATSAGGGRVLIVAPSLASSWVTRSLVEDSVFGTVSIGGESYRTLQSREGHRLSAVELCPSPDNFADAMSFATAIHRTRAVESEPSIANGIFVEQLSLVLPVPGSAALSDSVVLGRYLTGGVAIPIEEGRRLAAILSWLPSGKIAEVCQAAGVAMAGIASHATRGSERGSTRFSLPGRPALEAFFNEHVVDIVENAERYAALGVPFPSAIVLHGPPGSGKTFAVDRLVEYLGWPRFEVSSESVASPYIHETGRKVSAVFAAATKDAPAVVVIDEMDAFLAERNSDDGTSAFRVEEVAEFLRQIPAAAQNRVLVIAMTNRLDAIDRAILRRGRFDHLIEVGMATDAEVEALLRDLLAAVPHESDVDVPALARALGGRPLADVSFILREAARLTARDGRTRISRATLDVSVKNAAPRNDGGAAKARIGFTQ
jgi:hypothetical protein